MDAGIKSRWTAALRSGDYKQGIEKFKKDGKFCCLGVLCVVEGESPFAMGEGSCGNWGFVKPLFSSDPIEANNIAHRLAGMNDQGNTFKKIADYIDKNL